MIIAIIVIQLVAILLLFSIMSILLRTMLNSIGTISLSADDEIIFAVVQSMPRVWPWAGHRLFHVPGHEGRSELDEFSGSDCNVLTCAYMTVRFTKQFVVVTHDLGAYPQDTHTHTLLVCAY